MHNCLVVCYSRSGHTARIGKEFADLCGADLEFIDDVSSRSGPLGYLRSVYESLFHKEPRINTSGKDPGDYAVVVLGTPVWAGNMAAPMRSYLARHRMRFHRIALFCTMGGRGGDRTLEEMADLCGKAPMARIAITDAEIRHGSYRSKLQSLQSRALELEMS